MANLTALERSLFEVWAKTQAYDLARMPTNGEYYDQTTNDSWLAWQGRASMPSPFAEPNELDPPGGIQGLHEGRQGAIRSPALLTSKTETPYLDWLRRIQREGGYAAVTSAEAGHILREVDSLRAAAETSDEHEPCVSHLAMKEYEQALISIAEILERDTGMLDRLDFIRTVVDRALDDSERAPETKARPRGKPCTCDNCLGSSVPCRVEAGERLGELWYCRKAAESQVKTSCERLTPGGPLTSEEIADGSKS